MLGWNCARLERFAVAAKLATLSGSVFLSACATGGSGWMDHTVLVLRPSHHQALLAYSFGGDEPRQEAQLDARRNVAASIAAAVVVNDNPLPSVDTMDFKGGRVYIHTPRTK